MQAPRKVSPVSIHSDAIPLFREQKDVALAEGIRRSLVTVALALGLPHFAASQTTPALPQSTTVSAIMPAAVAYDSSGNLYIAVRAEHVVRRVDTLGQVTTIAGTGEQGFSGDGGQATAADLDSPSGVAVDGSGTVYIADSHNHRVRTVSNGVIATVAGTGIPGYSGDGGSATSAQLFEPTAISVDGTGNLYIADTMNHCIRKVAGGVITTFAGTGLQGFSGDGGAAVAAQLDSPMGVSADPNVAGKVYIGDTHNQSVRVVDASGIISTLAGTGVAGFGGDGGASTSAALASPKGIGIGSNGTIYIADSQNERVRAIAGGVISTFAGDGEQGFAGDLGAPGSAILDTPWAVAVSGAGIVALADTHNQRVRAASGTAINTVAGVPPALTEGLLLSGPASGVYGTAVGTLSASFSNGANVATGMATLTDGGTPLTSVSLSGNAASFDLSSLAGGVHSLVVSYAGDAADPAIASGVYVVNIAPAAQSLSFTGLTTSLTYSPGLTETLAATASSGLPVSFTVSGPATLSGSTLTVTGPGTVTVTATQAGNADYAASTSVQQIAIAAAPITAASLSPGTLTLGASNTTLTVTGSGFTSSSVVELNGAPLQTMFVSFTELTAVLPQATTPGTDVLTVLDTASGTMSGALNLKVTPPIADAVLSVPAQSTSGQQPSVNLQLTAAYPVPITGVLTLSFQPSSGQAVSDPAVQLSTGGSTLTFTVPANSTALPSVSVDTGTLAGTLTLTLSLTAAGVDVTPAAARTATIAIPGQVPEIQSGQVSFTQSGSTLTVTVVGYSNTRDMAQAIFTFTAAPGSSLATNSLTLPATTLFADWFNQSASFSNGSNFTYSQTFNLSDPSAVVSGVSVQLVNSVGASAVAASQPAGTQP